MIDFDKLKEKFETSRWKEDKKLKDIVMKIISDKKVSDTLKLDSVYYNKVNRLLSVSKSMKSNSSTSSLKPDSEPKKDAGVSSKDNKEVKPKMVKSADTKESFIDNKDSEKNSDKDRKKNSDKDNKKSKIDKTDSKSKK